MMSRFTGYRAVAVCFWFLSIVAIILWSLNPAYYVGWDLHVYANAIKSLRAGHDPYLDGIAVQRAYHALLEKDRTGGTPFTYVYSPITLPLLGLIGRLPLVVTGSVYWVMYALMTAATIWVGMRLIMTREQPVFQLIAPVVVFFPGLLQNDVLFSGNVAYILYGFVFLAAYLGWRRGNWAWFYAVTLAASCLKAPMLTVLAIPVFSARRQWVPALATGAAGLVLFVLQPVIWPDQFRHYLEAVELQFSFNHDFSSSPAGLLADGLYDFIPYRYTSLFYVVYAAMVAYALWALAKRFFAGRLTFKEWMPVLLLGTLLLNPRIMEYDIAPMTLPMTLILWRFVRRGQPLPRAIAVMAMLFALLQSSSQRTWRPTVCVLMVVVFTVGVWDLLQEAAETTPPVVVDEEQLLLVAEA